MRATLRLAALALAIVAVPRLSAADPLPPNLALVPPDADGFIAVRVADLWTADSAAAVRKMAKDNKEIATGLDELQRATGLTLADFTQVVLVLPEPGALGPPAVIVQTGKPYDKAKVLARGGAGPEEKKAHGKPYHINEKMGEAFYFPSPQVFVFGETKKIEKILAAGPRPADGALAEALGRAGEKHALVIGFDIQAIGKVPKNKPPEVAPLFEARSATITVDVGKDAVTLSARVRFADEGAAKEGEKAAAALLDEMRKGVRTGIDEIGKQKPRDDVEKAMTDLFLRTLKDADAALKTAKPERKGNVVHGDLRVPSAEPASAVIGSVVALGWVRYKAAEPPKEEFRKDAPVKDR
jgi:hypothetical protein